MNGNCRTQTEKKQILDYIDGIIGMSTVYPPRNLNMIFLFPTCVCHSPDQPVCVCTVKSENLQNAMGSLSFRDSSREGS